MIAWKRGDDQGDDLDACINARVGAFRFAEFVNVMTNAHTKKD